MGGLFRAPKPVVVAPPASIPPTVAPAAADSAEASARAEAASRSRRGIGGTIATSARGVLTPSPAEAKAGPDALAPQPLLPVRRKSLLGE